MVAELRLWAWAPGWRFSGLGDLTVAAVDEYEVYVAVDTIDTFKPTTSGEEGCAGSDGGVTLRQATKYLDEERGNEDDVVGAFGGERRRL